MKMRTVNMTFESKVFDELKEMKGGLNWEEFMLSLAKKKGMDKKGTGRKGKTKEEKTDVSVVNTIKVFEVLLKVDYRAHDLKLDDFTKELQKFKSDISEEDIEKIDEIFLEDIHTIKCVKEILEEIKDNKNNIKKIKKYRNVVNKIYNVMKKK